jgi:2-keto-4-pentenoate hydratase
MSKPAALVEVAESLRNATGLAPVPSVAEPLAGSIDDAYVVQAINRQQWQAEGRRMTGYKVAFTTAESQKAFGTNEPVYGTLFEDMRFESGSTIPTGILAAPKVEGEIVLELGADLDGEADVATIRRSVAAIYPALEIPDSPISGKLTAVDMAAANAAAAGYVLGERHAIDAGFDLAAISLTMKHNGKTVSSGVSSICMGDPLNVLVWLARKLAAAGIPMRAGQIVFAGSLIPIIAAAPGDSFEAVVDGLGTVGVTFASESRGIP